ncbi:MAG: hypothetical protein ACOYXR_02320 [Nitrospirota bacterium]
MPERNGQQQGEAAASVIRRRGDRDLPFPELKHRHADESTLVELTKTLRRPF